MKGWDDIWVVDSLLSKEECEQIRKVGDATEIEPGMVSGAEEPLNGYTARECDVAWLYDDGLKNRFFEMCKSANQMYWGFDIDFFQNEAMQYTTYRVGGVHRWHTDTGLSATNPSYVRKLTIVAQLSEPHEYEGGEFMISEHPGNEFEIEELKNQGTVMVMPSFIVHQVNEVTKGERRTLVGWIEGRRFK